MKLSSSLNIFMILITVILGSCSHNHNKSNIHKGYLLSLQMAVQAIELSRVTKKDFTVRCHPNNDYTRVVCKFSRFSPNKSKQVNSSKELLQKSFNNGLLVLNELPSNIKLTFKGLESQQ